MRCKISISTAHSNISVQRLKALCNRWEISLIQWVGHLGNYFTDSSKSSFRHMKPLSCGESDVVSHTVELLKLVAGKDRCVTDKWPRAQRAVGGRTQGLNLEQIISQHLGTVFTSSSWCWEVYSFQLPPNLVISSGPPMANGRSKAQRQLNENYFIALYFSPISLPAWLVSLSLWHWRLWSLLFLSGHCTVSSPEPEMGISQLSHNSCHSLWIHISQPASKSPCGHFHFPWGNGATKDILHPACPCLHWQCRFLLPMTPQCDCHTYIAVTGMLLSPVHLLHTPTTCRWAHSRWWWGRTRREIVQKFICIVHNSGLSSWVRWGVISMTPSS